MRKQRSLEKDKPGFPQPFITDEASMDKFINNQAFMTELFDEEEIAERASEIGTAILTAQSLRLTDISVAMEGKSEAGYKRIQRFLQKADPRLALWRLFQEDAEFVIGDPTEIERPQAWKTEYVGTLKDGKTKGFWAFAGLKDLLGERPLVLDREFSYLELMLNFLEEQINWVIRLNLRSHPPKFYDSDGKEVALTISPGGTVILNKIWYMGKVLVNIAYLHHWPACWRRIARLTLWRTNYW
jgi:hypothetical protein